MDSKTNKQLIEAKALFYSSRLVEAYTLFRRYFDRLPFKPEKEHVEHLGMFVRILVEVGKEYELKFYREKLEDHYDKTKDPNFAFALGIVYTYYPETLEASKKLLEIVVAHPDAKPWHGKAKMHLARYYDMKGDTGSCRALIESIQTDDPELQVLVDIWKAKILRDEKKFDEAEAFFVEILKRLDPKKDWYPHFSAKLGLTLVFVAKRETQKAQDSVVEIRELFRNRHFRTIQSQLENLQKLIRASTDVGTIQVKSADPDGTFSYAGKTFSLNTKSPAGKLLILFLKKRVLDKAMIVKNLYARQYNGEQDDKLIYYHIHALRKRLKALGLPADAIVSGTHGYRLTPQAEFA